MGNNSILSQIGNTPLIKLKQASELTGCNIYGKAEYFNPGQSVKDRAALFIVNDALKKRKIKKSDHDQYRTENYQAKAWTTRTSKTIRKRLSSL